jgi:hypothetical protein
MNVVVQALDGSKIYPSYSPEHKAHVSEFYATKVANGEIAGYIIHFDDETMIAEGRVL